MRAMLRAEKDGVFRRGFRIAADGREITTFDPSWWRAGGTFELDGHEYTVRGNMWGGKYGMVDERDTPVAAAAKVGRKEWTVEADGTVYRFRRSSFWSSEQALMQDDREVGRISKISAWRSGAVAELPGLSLPLQVFVVAVVLTMWEQQRAAASSGGGG